MPWNWKRKRLPATVVCRRLSVVRPYDLLARAYSRPPMRISVISSRRTRTAITLSCVSPDVFMSRSTRRRIRGSASPNVSRFWYLPASRTAVQAAWYRYCLRPRASRPVACRCPWARAQIHTRS
ncbi:hypothetical protein D3C72_1561270 [compost metagenome]